MPSLGALGIEVYLQMNNRGRLALVMEISLSEWDLRLRDSSESMTMRIPTFADRWQLSSIISS